MPGWDTDFAEGLLDDFDFEIVKAYFAPDAQYNSGATTVLHWEGKTDNLDKPDQSMFISMGKGWVSTDGGKTIRPENGKPVGEVKFNKSTLLAKIIERCIVDFGLVELLQSRGEVTEAKVWEGLVFHMKMEDIYKDAAGLDDKAKNGKLMPVRFVKVARGVGASSNGSAPAASAPAASGGLTAAEKIAAAKAKSAGGGGSVASLRDRVVDVLKQHTDFASAQAAAFEIEGVDGDDALVDALMDESGLWAEVTASV